MPTNLINLESVSKAFGAGPVLDRISLGLATGERIGVVGRNGGGKTTLLNIMAGIEEPDSGRVTHTRGLRLAVLPQSEAGLTGTIRELVVGSAAEHEWASDARVRAVLDGLGMADLGLDSPVDRLSGGERRRVALAARLVGDTDVLILDEPTNHLDVAGVMWLAEHVSQRPGALLVVTHDRWFLDAVVEQTWEVTDGAVHSYAGGYAAYVLARAERERQQAAAEARRSNLLRKELAWLRRGPPARTSKPQFRIEAAQALIEDEPPARDSVALQAFATRRLGKSVYDVERVSYRDLLADVTWRVGPGDRIGVVGVNGSGKSTLLRLLVGELTPDRGRVRVGQTVAAGYLSQEVAVRSGACGAEPVSTELPVGLRVLEAVTEIASRATLGGVELSASVLLERFGFPSAKQWTPVGELSGGERRRLQLLRLLMTEPNVLLLDEPTNDLDIDTLTALEDVLDSWVGTVIVVSHDRYLVERVCDSVVALLGDGRLSELPGGVDDYLQRRSSVVAATGATRARRGDSRAARKELGRLERQMSTLQQRESRLHDDLAAHATDYEKVAELNSALQDVVAQRETLETQWLELADDID